MCTYQQLAHQMAAVGAALHAAGIARNDRVAVALPTGPEMATAFLGVSSVATCAPLNTAYTADEATFYLRDLSARALIVPHGRDLPVRDAAHALGVPCFDLEVTAENPAGIFGLAGLGAGSSDIPAAAPEDVALVLHTSGTTARPKQVPLSHANLCASAGSVAATLGLAGADRCLNVMPLFHIHGLVAALMASVTVGGSVICTSGFDGSRFLGWMHELAATWYTAVPTVHQAALAAAAADPGAASRARLRFIRSSSAPLPPQVMAELEGRFGAPVIEAYGMTEASHQMTSNPLPPGERRPGTVGLAAGPEVAIMDAVGRLLDPGQTGEVVIRGPGVTTGYVANEQANAEAFSDGWFRTGDQGVFDADGYLTITGRLKEMINRGGEKVAPREVDEALLAHPSVARALAFAVPHPTLGEDVAAAVVPVPGADLDPADLRHFVAERITAYKVPRRIVVVDELPTGPTGKPTRIGTAERLGITLSGELSAPREPTSPLEASLAALWGRLLGLETVPVDQDFVVLGGDSLSALELLAQVRDTFRVDVPVISLFAEGSNVRGMAALIERFRTEEPLVVPTATGLVEEGALSALQERLWFLDALEGGLAAYNASVALRIRGPLDRAALESALDALVTRHEILRTTFPTAADGRPRAAVQPPAHVPLPLERIDDASADPDARLARARARVQRELEVPFDLAAGPPLRALVVQMRPDDHLFVLVCHHMTTDGSSRRLMARELSLLYDTFGRGAHLALPPIDLRFGDLAAQQRQRLSDHEEARELVAWWQTYLSDLPGPLELPLDRRRPPRQDHSGGTLRARLPADVWGGVGELARAAGATPFMALLTGFFALLRRYTGREDLTAGVAVMVRTVPGSQDVVGPFADTVVVRGAPGRGAGGVHRRLRARRLLRVRRRRHRPRT